VGEERTSRPQDRERYPGFAHGDFGGKLGASIGVDWLRLVALGQGVIRRGPALRADRGDEHEVSNAVPRRRSRKLGRGRMVDALVVLGGDAAGVSDAGEVNDLRDAIEIRRPIEGLRQIGMHNRFDAGRKAFRRRAPHGGTHRPARSGESPDHGAADETGSAGDKDPRHASFIRVHSTSHQCSGSRPVCIRSNGE
jgi:hypothetical protein